MDAFQRAVDDGRRQLGISEGRQVGLSELLRKAGFPERAADSSGLTMKGARYHLEASNNASRKGGHRVPAELVERLGAVLPGGVEPLRRAAQVAAGFNVEIETGREDIPTALVRFLGDEGVTEEEKRETAARLLQILAEQAARSRRDVPRVSEQ